jgi:CelD/BcsL family acetyltransferase involved in cellulose biosynthesis
LHLQHELVDSLESVREEWSDLAHQSRNVFATPEWASVWWRHFGTGQQRITACRGDAGRLVAILPLYVSRAARFRVLRFLGHGPGDELGPVCAPADRSAAARTLRHLLEARSFAWDVFLGERLPGDIQWSLLMDAQLLREEASPALQFTGGWEAFLASRSSNFRQQVRRKERALARTHEVQFRLTHDPARLQEDLGTLFALHGARWQQSVFEGEREAFHRDFAACALKRGWLRLWFLEVDGVAVAGWYGLRFAGVDAYYQAGRDPRWDRASVGFVLLAHSIREALEDGVQEYRFLRGAEQYKQRFANAGGGLETIARGGGPLGSAAVLLGTAASRSQLVRRAVKRPLNLY